MRVLILSQYFWPESFRISEVARTLKDVDCDVLVLTGQPNYPDGITLKGYAAWAVNSEIHDGIEILRVPLIPRRRGTGIRLFLNYLSFVFSASLFGPIHLRSRQIDCILVYAPSPILQAIPAIWLGWLKGAKVVVWVQDLWPESLSATGFIKNSFLLACVSSVVSWIYKKSDLLLAQSKAFIAPIKVLAGTTPVVLHPHPGELAFSSPFQRESLLHLEKGFNVIFAGNLGTVQALETIVEAARLLREETDIRFVLIGSGSRLASLKGDINRLNLTNIQLPGRFPQEEMPAILHQASVLLVSLVRDPTISLTVPGKIQAYLAACKPIIACMDGEGARIVMEAGAGVACPAEDAGALAAAVIHLRDTPQQELNRMGENAVAYYQNNFEPKMLSVRLRKILSDAARTNA
jgi:glycosyltransferase involved in cell wall biosynthesis